MGRRDTRRSRRADVIRASVLLAGLVVLAACSSGASDGPATPATDARSAPAEHGYVGRRGAPRVAIAGDSITELSRSVILSTLTPEYRVRVNAFTGRTIAEVTPAIVRQVATHPDIAVVNLGTNDMDREHRGFRADLDRMLHVVASVPCVEVFTIYDGRHDPEGANVGTRINARLVAAAAEGSIRLIDWNAAVHRDPDLVVADGIHPGAAGQRWIATSIRDAIRSDC